MSTWDYRYPPYFPRAGMATPELCVRNVPNLDEPFHSWKPATHAQVEFAGDHLLAVHPRGL